MSLTLALVLVAVVVVAAMVAHSVWSARQATPKRATVVLPTPEQRVDPSLLHSAHGTADAAAEPRAPEPRALRRAPRIDALIDAIATLTLEAPVSAEHVLAHLPAQRRAGSKPMHFEGLNADSGEWEPLADGQRAGQRYGELQVGVQMANRSGALNEIEYSEFAQLVQGFAEGVAAMADLPDMLDVVARARELDNFASPNDVQLTVQLRDQGVAWSPGYVQQVAARHGFMPAGVAGRLVLPAAEDGAPPLLLVAFDPQAALADDPNQAVLRELTLSLDVPQSAEAAEPFATWQEAARGLAADMEGTLVDDDGRPITLHHFATIAGELKTIYTTLEARDMAAGSAVARRLFS